MVWLERFSTAVAVSIVLGTALIGSYVVSLAQNPLAPNALPGAQQPLPPGTASVSGTIVTLGTNDPIPGASVELRKIDCNNFANPPEVFTAVSGPDGKFAFQNLRAGGWCIVATAPSGKYSPAEYLQRGPKGRGVTIPVSDGQRVTGIQLAMPPTGGITGRILDGDREPLAHARVQAMELFYQDGQKRLYILSVAQTNDRGEYRFYWLPPGRYYVAVVPEDTRRSTVTSVQPPPGVGGHREDMISPVIVPRITPRGDVIEERYVTVYYPNQTDPQRATPIDLLPGTNATGVDIFLNSGLVPSFHVRGTVRNGVTGAPGARAQLRLAPREWTSTVIMSNVTADENGNFDIGGVISGSYVLYSTATMPNPAAPPPDPNAPRGAPRGAPPAPATPGAPATPPIPATIQLTGRIPIEVSGGSLDNQVFEMVAGTSIPGRLDLAAAGANAAPRGFSISLARDPDIVGVPSPSGRGSVQADGTFSLPNVGAGDYRIYVVPLLVPFQYGVPNVPQAMQNTYVKSIRLGNADVLVNGLHIAGGTPPGQLEIAIGTGGRLDGVVLNNRQEPVPSATIALVPEQALRRRLDLYRTAMSDIQGRFRMQGVPPGIYKAFAWEEVDRDAWQDADFIRSVEDRGRIVDIREGVQAATDLPAIPPERR